jgi:type IV fimbrial biogenesis protein FimT
MLVNDMTTVMHRFKQQSQRGFTLVEAMVVISIMAILAGTSVSSFVWLNQSTQVRGATFDLIADLDFARSEAVKRNADIVVAPRNGDWGNGWTVNFGANVLRSRDPVGAAVGFTAAPPTLTFDGAGRASLMTVGNFQICPPSGGSTGRTIRLDPSGLSRSTKTTCAG